MKLYVPHLGDDLRLLSDWTFTLYSEYRNADLVEYLKMGNPHPYDYGVGSKREEWTQENMIPTDNGWRGTLAYKKRPVIPAGTILRVKRIFIRQGAADYDSMTFATKLPDAKGKLKSVRFWAKLNDCNNIEFEKVTEE